jgi:cytochrome b
MSGIRLSIRVWDLPIRLFHWAIVALLAVGYVSQLEFWMHIHYLAGYSALTLLLFRLVWGFVGSDSALFRNFLKGPTHVLRHLARFPRREPDTELGHNPAGGWMVLVLLGLLAVESVSGLFSRDDEIAEGPLAHDLGGHGTDLSSSIHAIAWNLILVAVALHVLAILAYWVVRRQNLLRPMITGKKRLPAATRPPRMGNSLQALAILAGAAALVAIVVNVF